MVVFAAQNLRDNALSHTNISRSTCVAMIGFRVRCMQYAIQPGGFLRRSTSHASNCALEDVANHDLHLARGQRSLIRRTIFLAWLLYAFFFSGFQAQLTRYQQQPRLIFRHHGFPGWDPLEGASYHVRGMAHRYRISMWSPFLQPATRWQRCPHHQHRISRAVAFQHLNPGNKHVCWHSFRLSSQNMLRPCCFNSLHPNHLALYQA
jgi:hypothetical protein